MPTYKTPGKNICKCPNPPGGTAVCDADQLAICRIRNGQIEAECLTVPKQLLDHATDAGDPEPFAEWALESALKPDIGDFDGIRQGSSEPVGRPERFLSRNLRTFLNGEWRFRNRRNGDEVTISHPASIRPKGDPFGSLSEVPSVMS